MKKHLLTLVILLIGYVPVLSAQGYLMPEIKKPQPFKTLPKEYVQHLEYQEKLALKNNEDWWQPDTVVYHIDNNGPNQRNLYFYNQQGYIIYRINQSSWNYESWTNVVRYTYEYDNANKLILYTKQEYNESNGVWVEKTKDEYKYNSNNQLITILSMSYVNEIWKNRKMIIYNYDYNNNLTHELYQEYRENNWVNDCQYLYTYDSNNNLLTETQQNWSDDILVDVLRYTYTYDERGNQKTYLYEIYLNNKWKIENYKEYTYNETNHLIIYLTKQWDDYENVFVDDWCTTYTYDENYNVISKEGKAYYNNIWYNSEFETFTYNINNMLSTYQQSYWMMGDWEVMLIRDYIYDERNNLIDNIEQLYYGSGLRNEKRYTYKYDENNNGVCGQYFRFNNNWYNDIAIINISYNSDQSIFYGEYYTYLLEISYTKTPKPAGIEEVGQSTQEIAIYPNPSKDYINISVENDEIENVQIYNLTGKLVKQEKSNKININDLPVGMYIIKVETDGGNCIKKVIKD
jgi:hypothetical protein